MKTFRPLTPSLRYLTISDYSDITKTRPEKALVYTRKKTGGRNSYGRVTARAIGGGHKQKVRSVDFRRKKFGIEGKVIAVEIIASKPRGVFDAAVRAAMSQYACVTSGDDTVYATQVFGFKVDE